RYLRRMRSITRRRICSSSDTRSRFFWKKNEREKDRRAAPSRSRQEALRRAIRARRSSPQRLLPGCFGERHLPPNQCHLSTPHGLDAADRISGKDRDRTRSSAVVERAAASLPPEPAGRHGPRVPEGGSPGGILRGTR